MIAIAIWRLLYIGTLEGQTFRITEEVKVAVAIIALM